MCVRLCVPCYYLQIIAQPQPRKKKDGVKGREGGPLAEAGEVGYQNPCRCMSISSRSGLGKQDKLGVSLLEEVLGEMSGCCCYITRLFEAVSHQEQNDLPKE